MALGPPPSPTILQGLPHLRLSAGTLHRAYRLGRVTCWWFSTRQAGVPADQRGRFDLREPYGACYTGTTVAAAVLEAFQEHGRGLLPASELRSRRLASIDVPATAPRAAKLTAARARAAGVTAALWADNDRSRTQTWAEALHRAGWRALYHGIQHDPTGRMRAVTLFDTAGEHDPYDDTSWTWRSRELEGDDDVMAALVAHGYVVAADDVDLPLVDVEDLL